MSIEELTTKLGRKLLAELPPYNPDDVFSLHTQLQKKGIPSEVIAALLTQSRLRVHAQEKFGAAATQMFFTAAGLEQATRACVAAAHAEQFRRQNIKTIIDYGCGIGADARSFALAGLQVIAIEKDSEAAAAARFNLRNFPAAKVIEADARTLELSTFSADAIWIDPARRENGRRIKNPAHWQPSLEEALELAAQFPSAGIKVAPGIDYSLLPASSHVQWISVEKSLVEAVIWHGGNLQPGRSALLVTPQQNYCYDAQVNNPRLPAEMLTAAQLEEYIYEPDPAIIRAGAIAALATEKQLRPVSDKIAYLTGKKKISTPFLQSFQVLEILPSRSKVVRKELRERGIGKVEIKKRGTSLIPENYRRSLHLDPNLPNNATLISTPLLGKASILLCKRL